MSDMGNPPEHQAVIRETVADFVRHHGSRKRGLAAAAAAIGIGLRSARAIYDREWISAAHLEAALAARRALRLARREQLRRELLEIERELDNAQGMAAGGESCAVGGGSLAGCGGLVRQAGEGVRR